MVSIQLGGTRSQIFGDDSSKTGRYYVYGSLHVNQNQFRALDDDLRKVLDGYGHEIKWSETRHLEVHKAFLEALFGRWPTWSYRCIVVPNTQIKQAVKGPERALLKAKLVYLLLNRYARTTLQEEPEFYVTLDQDEFDPEVQQIALNNAFLRDNGGDHRAFKIRAADSKEHAVLQAVDLITGAVAWVWNGGLSVDLSTDANVHRLTVASIVAKRARIAGFKKKGEPPVPQGDVRTLGRYTFHLHERGFRIFPVDLTKSPKWQKG